MTKNLLLLLLLFAVSAPSFSQCEATEVFSNDSTNAVCIQIDEKVRTFHSNNLPNHSFGTWPSNNPVSPQELTYYMCAFPQKADQFISLYDAGNFMGGCSQYVEFGIGINGVRMAPYGARWFVNPNTQEENRDWNVEALEMFSMDFNNSHSNGGGEYHYHGIPYSYFIDSLNIEGLEHSPIVGYAADGFPVYYKYVYSDPNNSNSEINAFESGYTLKPGNRPGNGVTAPDGPHDGFYVEDYEYLDNNWPLDECNGRFGVTPEYPEGTYYYVMTDNWPYIPRCFYGTIIDNSFRIGPNCPPSDAAIDCSEEIISNITQYEEMNILIAPNPSTESLRILSNDASIHTQITQISIYDLNGKVWYLSKGYEELIDIHALAAGSYFLQINFGESQITKKIIVQ